MKKIALVLILLLLAGFVYLSVAGRDMQTIKSEIEIQATPEKVWSLVADIDNWQEWSPTINASTGQAVVGSTVSITMMSKDPEKDGPKYSPKIIQLNEPNYFHWRAHMLAGFIFTNDKIIEIEKTDTGSKVTHSETFKGAMAALMKGSMETGVPPMLSMMNEALKQAAEQ